ncbi:Abhydrolase domain-containing protein ACTT2-2 [Colletotrichum spinosum]|uniref:Abhydrolase domain-containing protein ACTT2-2 n=1 Tax=Colletotrichum spinosum TaxID=1347390 RepID=A0A4R8PWM5_9PEZI|nr:Abhydrolase domain-containing protein ACTT2-2 [Colletotrichum spinosum]
MADSITEKEKHLPPSSSGEHDLGKTTQEVTLTQDGFSVHPQPVHGDALDPLNWSTFQKHTILAIVMALYFMFTYITTTTVPSFPELQAQYALSLEQVNWTVAIPALGLALGPLLWSSAADIIGRRPVFIAGTVVALAATVGAARAPGYGGYMAARLFQGLGVSPAATVGLAIINDMFFEHERGQKVGLWVLAIDLGLLAGPLVGGFVDLADHYWIQWVTAVFFAAILAAELVLLPETLYPRDYMLSRTQGLGVSTAAGDEKAVTTDAVGRLREVADVPRTKKLAFVNVTPVPATKHPKPWASVVRFGKLFRYPVVPIATGVYCFGWYWWVLSVITMIPVAYAEYSPQTQGLFFIGLIVGTLVSEIFFSGKLSDWLVVRLARRNGGTKTAEMRLWLAYPAALLTAVGLVVWGVSIDKGYHWMVGQVAFALFGAGIQMGNTAICSYIVDAYPLQSMAVVTFYAVLLNLSAFVDPFFIAPWVDAAGYGWTFAGHGIVTVFFCIPALAALHWFGGAMRRRSGEPDWVNPEYDHDVVREELYEPLWRYLHRELQAKGVAIRSIWMADSAFQGKSLPLNASSQFSAVSWQDHAEDLVQLMQHFRGEMKQPVIGIGHSMGGCHIATMSVIQRRIFSSMILLDPAISPPGLGMEAFGFEHMTLRLRTHWPNRQMAETSVKRMFETWDPEVIDLFMGCAIKDDAAPAVPRRQDAEKPPAVSLVTEQYHELANYLKPTFLHDGNVTDPPLVYQTGLVEVFRMLGHVTCSTFFLCGGRGAPSDRGIRDQWKKDTASFRYAELPGERRRVEVEVLPELGHFLVMENPRKCAGFMAGWIEDEARRWNDAEKKIGKLMTGLGLEEKKKLADEWMEALRAKL